MSEPFDPYYKWLGIAAKDQPPNCYRLLGIERFEEDPDVIANAADQRMGHVRTFQAGEHSAQSQQILSELARAKVELLNSQKKAGYDEALRAELQQPVVQAPVVQAPAVQTPVQTPVPTVPTPSIIAPAPVAVEPAPEEMSTAGCVVFLVDESTSMSARVAQGTKSKVESIATALNSLLNQLTYLPPSDGALVGYRGGGHIGCRWKGPLGGREFVPTDQLGDAPAAVEDRVRKIPGLGGFGVARQETIRFPVWYIPELGQRAPAAEAFRYCAELLSRRAAGGILDAKPPLVIHFVADLPADESLAEAVQPVAEWKTPLGHPLVFHVHLGSAARVPPTLYASTDAHLTEGPRREMFRASGELLPSMIDALRSVKVTVNAGARGMVYHGQMADLIRFFSVVKAYAMQAAPAPKPLPAPAPSPVPMPAAPVVTAPASPEPTPPSISADSANPPPLQSPPEPKPIPELETPPEPEAAAEPETLSEPVSEETKEPVTDAVAPEPVPEETSTTAPETPPPVESVSEETPEKAAPEETPSAETTAEAKPPEESTAEKSTPGGRVLVVLLLDRSVEAPQAEGPNVWLRVQQRGNEVLQEIVRKGGGQIDVSPIAYGGDSQGETEIASPLSGSLAEQLYVADTELVGGARRIEETTEQIPNGVGGLVSVTRKQPVFIDMPPAPATSPVTPFSAAAQVAECWTADHPDDALGVLVLHLTRGRFDPQQFDEAVASLANPDPAVGSPVLYHLVLTETPRRSVAYPAVPDEIADPAIRKLWEASDPLLGADALAAERPGLVTPESRGFVVNGKFDLLLPGLRHALAND
ncbi:MAG: hypothetical protein HQ581_18490 [Planctomycetes bacterium]|nr:hypothetical protein [Planctomycetota bacterium]